MKNTNMFFPALLLITNLLSLNLASNELPYTLCYKKGNYTDKSTYASNLRELFSSLSTDLVAAIRGYSQDNIGEGPDRVYGLILCRGDLNSSMCSKCLSSVVNIAMLCPQSKDSTIYYDYCLLRYSNQKFFENEYNSAQIILSNTTRKTFPGHQSEDTEKSFFNTTVYTLLSKVSEQAAYNSRKLFATGVMNITASLPVIYGMAQCTPDYFFTDYCNFCLQYLISQLLSNFDGAQSGWIVGDRCSLWYDTDTLFFGNPDIQLGSISGTAMPDPKGGKRRTRIVIGSVTGALLILGCFISFWWIRKLRYPETENSQEERVLATSDETLNLWSRERSSGSPLFDFNQIATATGNFSLDNKLGQGGFGPVYKGVLQDGLEIAVKRLSTYSGQGLIEFKNEIQVIAKLQHRNLVRLVGWCIQGEEKILIYEFMPNKSLDFFIFDKTRGALLSWGKRFEIIEGIAQGILYLHKHSRLRIIHRDLKASNVLLDSEMNPKISDFGLARIFGPKELQANTNRVVGTYGYMAPEYASEGLFSAKSDVFSYGVLLLEIVSGKRNMGFHQYGDFLNILGYAWDRWKGGNMLKLICPTLSEVCQTQIERCIHVALLCVQENPADRPAISDVIAFLTTENIVLPEPKQPAYFNIRVTEKAEESSDFDGSSCSINDVTLTNPEVR